MNNELVQMTTEERAEFEAFRAAKEKKSQELKAKQDRESFKVLVDETINNAFPRLSELSLALINHKSVILEEFQSAIAMKEGIFGVKAEQLSHTFTNTEGTIRITVGKYMTDNYRDTVNEGITIVNEFLTSLGKDENSRALVKAVLKLLSKDSKGTLKASRVMQLRQMATETGNERFLEGVKIIEESYQPIASKVFIRCDIKSDKEVWEALPLGMTEA